MTCRRVTFDEPGLREDWQRLLHADAAHDPTFFQTWEWNKAWWKIYGEPERKKELWLLKLEEEGRTVGIAPLYMQKRTIGAKNIWTHVLWLAHELSPYPELLYSSADPERLWREIISFTARPGGASWFELRDIRTQHSLHRCSGLGVRVIVEEHDPVLHWNVGDAIVEGDDPLQRIRPSFRRNMKKAIRNFECNDSLRWQFRRGFDREAASALVALNEQRFRRKSFFTDERNRNFYELLVSSAGEKLFYATISDGGRIIHVLFGFDFHDVLYYFMAGMDESFLSTQPGIMNFYFTLRWTLEHGYKRFDFLRGSERYKYDLGATAEQSACWTLVPRASNPLYETVRRLRKVRKLVE